MALANKLARWREAGLLTQAQSDAILAYEATSAQGFWQRGLAFVGVFAIALGILAIVAANWWEIPAFIKLLGHLLANVLAAMLVLHFNRQQQEFRRDLTLLLWFGLTLTCIALIGQVFQLNSELSNALLFWCVLSTPAVVLLANSRVVLLPWLLAWLTALAVAYDDYLSAFFEDDASLPMLVFGILLPAVLAWTAAHLKGSARQQLRQLLALTASIAPLVIASIACMFWYGSSNRLPFVAPLVVVLLTSIVATLARPLAVPAWLQTPKQLRELWWVCLSVIALPFLVPSLESDLLAAASFIALWMHFGHLAHRSGNDRLVSLSIALVSLRIYIIYLEVFGSLAQTGFGLIFSGGLLLLMLRFARKLSRNLRTQRTPEATP